MTRADQHPTAGDQTADDSTAVQASATPSPVAAPAGRIREAGERSQPANGGNLGYLYSIYRFYDGDDRLLYLGRSERVRQRIIDLEIGHPRGLPLGHDDGPKPWWREAVRIELEHLPPGTTDAEVALEEWRQIQAFRPAYNREFNEDVYDRSRVERAIDATHFEVDVATAEHERHDGVIRSRDRVVRDAEQAAERIRPAGAARLHYGRRRDPGHQRSTGASRAATPGHSQGGGRRRSRRSGGGSGSLVGLILVIIVLVVLVIAALVVSLQVVL